MKKNLLKLYIFTIVMFSDFVIFAQPGDDDTGGGLEDDDPPAAPINGKLIWLAIAGILFALYMYKSNKAQKRA